MHSGPPRVRPALPAPLTPSLPSLRIAHRQVLSECDVLVSAWCEGDPSVTLATPCVFRLTDVPADLVGSAAEEEAETAPEWNQKHARCAATWLSGSHPTEATAAAACRMGLLRGECSQYCEELQRHGQPCSGYWFYNDGTGRCCPKASYGSEFGVQSNSVGGFYAFHCAAYQEVLGSLGHGNSNGHAYCLNVFAHDFDSNAEPVWEASDRPPVL